MSIKHDIEVLKIIPSANKVKENALNQKETLARQEFDFSFSRDRLLEKILEKSQAGEAGYEFRSRHLRPQVAQTLTRLIQDQWLVSLTQLGYEVVIQTQSYNGYYDFCTMTVIWNKDAWMTR